MGNTVAFDKDTVPLDSIRWSKLKKDVKEPPADHPYNRFAHLSLPRPRPSPAHTFPVLSLCGNSATGRTIRRTLSRRP